MRYCSHFVHARSLSGFISSKESQPPCSEDTRAALWADLCGDGQRPPAIGQHHLANSHVNHLGTDLPVPAKPSDDCSSNQCLNYNPMRDFKTKPSN